VSSELLREAQDPNTTAARLMEIAQTSRDTWEAIAAHPAAYPGLLDWLGEHGDDAVKAAIARREIAQLPPPPPPAADDAPTAPIPAPPAPPASAGEPAAEPTLIQPAAVPAAPVETASAPSGSEPKGGSANAVRIGIVAVVLAALVGGGWFGVQALTGDDDKKSENTVGADSRTDDDDDAKDDEGDGGGEFCDIVDKTRDLGLSSLGTSGSAGTNREDLLDKLSEVTDIYRDLEDAAPAELKDDVAVMADYFDNLADTMSSAGSGAGSYESIDIEKFTSAGGRVSQYYATHCM